MVQSEEAEGRADHVVTVEGSSDVAVGVRHGAEQIQG
jgi:hypothetical protein